MFKNSLKKTQTHRKKSGVTKLKSSTLRVPSQFDHDSTAAGGSGTAVAKLLVLEPRGGRIAAVATAGRGAHLARFDRLQATAVLGGDGLFAKVAHRVGHAGPGRILVLLGDFVRLGVVFGAGAAAPYDAGGVLVDGEG